MPTVERHPSTEAKTGIRAIAELRGTDIEFAGGKGANLGELARATPPSSPTSSS
jgi:hypothetical protein